VSAKPPRSPPPLEPGPANLITDVAGLAVGNAGDAGILTGVTVVLPDRMAVAAVEQRGGAPGTREMDALKPASLVEGLHAVVLSGGSVFGLDAAGAVVTALAARGVGFRFGTQPHPCPVVPSAILFDLTNGGDKAWGPEAPYRRLGRAALDAAGPSFALGNAGAGLGATAGAFKGGLGSASVVVGGYTVGALVAVNCFGSVVNPADGRLWAEPSMLSRDGPPPEPVRLDHAAHRHPAIWAGSKASRGAAAGQNTTIAVVATDAVLSKADAARFAIMAADGLPRAIRPVHSPFDGDTVIALATGRVGLADPAPLTLASLGTAAADTLARAVARGVLAALPVPGWPSIGEVR
jgi:L-aminopeptidase/D-esterase-like protein